MLRQVPLVQLDDYFSELSRRQQKGVYFYRINGYNEQIHDFIAKYHEAARKNGAIIEGRLNNPDNNNLAYYGEIMGMDFMLDRRFINERLHKWLPRMSTAQCDNVSGSIFDVLTNLKRAGKNDNMLKNVYVKFMCWLYYKFEQVVHKLGDNELPKILFEGEVTNYEILFFNVLSIAGCDIVLLQYNGDAAYLKVDPTSSMSKDLKIPGLGSFPQGFSLRSLRQEMLDNVNKQRLYGEMPKLLPCTNAWMEGKLFEDLRKPVGKRGTDSRFFYNSLCRMNGAEDKVSYVNELYYLYNELRSGNRRMAVVNHTIDPPTPDEISAISRKNYEKTDQLILDMAVNFRSITDRELLPYIRRAFVDTILEESHKPMSNINKLTNKAVYLLCWLNRYRGKLFSGWKPPEVSVFFYLGGCRNENEAMFCRFLAKMPVDVVILAPDLNKKCCLSDKLLFEVNYNESLAVDKFPDQQQGIRIGTAAFQAERELDKIMYQDSGMYRDQQYEKAEAITLQTMYEEIFILWDQEMKYRPNFSTNNGMVHMPVIFSKVVGVKNGDVTAYWQKIKQLITPDTIVISNVPLIRPGAPNPMKQHATQFLRNGKLQRNKIKEHKDYPYKILRESMQEHILDKMQELLDRRLIKGTFQNGMEYNIIGTILNLDKRTIRMIQKFDFTKKNPKLIFIVTREDLLSVEDTIFFSFLSLIGFDVVFFVPTGYQCFEQNLTQSTIEVHEIGEYKYDLSVPNFNALPQVNNRHSIWREIFKRGN